MSRYKFRGYTITNCGYHQPDHCVWWEAVNENGEACFHGNTLREVEFGILDYEWEQKMKKKDEEIEMLKQGKSDDNTAAMREALELFVEYSELVCRMGIFNRDRLIAITAKARAALSAPVRNCDRFGGNKDKLIEACVRERGLLVTENFHEVFHHWLLAPAAEIKGNQKWECNQGESNDHL